MQRLESVPPTMYLIPYLKNKITDPDFENDIPKNYVCVRTHLDSKPIIGWVDRGKLAETMQAMDEAARLGTTLVASGLPKIDESARRPGESIFEGQQNELSYDRWAALISLVPDDQ